jgi:hypothetical protein
MEEPGRVLGVRNLVSGRSMNCGRRKKGDAMYYLLFDVSWPMSLPNSAPASKTGMIIPLGTLQPKVMIVRVNFTDVP